MSWWRKEQDAFPIARELVEEHKLAMQLVDVEHLFGGEKLTFYYVSEARIDFRELVKSMAKRFNLRIELGQMGIRDEANSSRTTATAASRSAATPTSTRCPRSR